MNESTKLPALLRLLDDPSPVVRAAVTEELAAHYSELVEQLHELNSPLDWDTLSSLEERLVEPRRAKLRSDWVDWMRADSGLAKLEVGLDLLSRFLSPFRRPTPLRSHLDDLAEECRRRFRNPSTEDLCAFLFVEEGFRGASKHYYAPANSDLVEVIEERRGLPITLALVLILVGDRLDLRIEGCNFPRHFYARVYEDETLYLIDAFREGARISEEEMLALFPDSRDAVRVLLRLRTDAETMMRRVLQNLVVAHQKMSSKEDVALFRELIEHLERDAINRSHAGPLDRASLEANQPKFMSGQLVRHRRSDYRGVVVDYDLHCRADEVWYQSNATQPDREQPWYHVFVDGSNVVTYAAESSLREDTDSGTVDHPLVPYFFSRFDEGRYVRNHEPWPETWSS